MKHQFTEDDLKQALRHTAYMDDGLRINIPAWVEDNDEVDLEQVDVFRAILDALPEPEPVADEWEQCEHKDIRADERFLVKLDGWTFEGRKNRNSDLVIKLPGVDQYLNTSLMARLAGNTKTGRASFYRIPAVVQHPDPERHPVIMGVVTRHGSNHDFGVRNWSNYHVYSDGQSEGFLNSDQITDWEPAKIVRIEEK